MFRQLRSPSPKPVKLYSPQNRDPRKGPKRLREPTDSGTSSDESASRKVAVAIACRKSCVVPKQEVKKDDEGTIIRAGALTNAAFQSRLSVEEFEVLRV